MIENERHPSWVSFVTIFLPIAQGSQVFLWSKTGPLARAGPISAVLKRRNHYV